MISYEAIYEAFTALLVIIAVSVVISLAWLSTNVREQHFVAFVLVHSPNNGERDSHREQNSGSNREILETSASQRMRSSTEVSSHREVDMEIKRITSEESSGDSQSKESVVVASTKSLDTNSPQVERVEDIPLRSEDSENSLSLAQSPTNKEERGNSSPESIKDDKNTREASEFSPPSKPSLENSGHIIPETELRKRRLQQFISMGEATTTTHLERLSEELTATLPSEISKGSTEDKNSVPVCSEGAIVAESVPSKGTKIKSISTEGAEIVESVSSEGAKVEELLYTEGKKVESIITEGTKVNESECSKGTKVGDCKDESPSSLNLVGEAASEERPPGSIKIRLKFLDETQRHVFANLTEQVGSFKRQHFSIEMDANRRIRLIFNGQLLSQDTSTLAQYGLFDNCVVHCHVSQPQHNNGVNSREAAAQDEEDAYVSRLFAPLLYGVLAVMWYLRFEYGHLFNAMSTIILIFLTALLLASTYLLYLTNPTPTTAAATTTTLPQSQSS